MSVQAALVPAPVPTEQNEFGLDPVTEQVWLVFPSVEQLLPVPLPPEESSAAEQNWVAGLLGGGALSEVEQVPASGAPPLACAPVLHFWLPPAVVEHRVVAGAVAD
jgi:hypothetical protein